MFQETSKKRRAGEIISIALILLLIVLIVSTFIIYGVFKDANSAPSFFGRRIYLMNSDSMEPRIEQGSAVFVKEGELPQTSGTVILCEVEDSLALVSFIELCDVTLPSGEVRQVYIVKTDAASELDAFSVSEEDIIGIATTYDSFLGGLIRFASSKNGMLVIVIVPCALLVIYEVVMLIISAKKKRLARSADSSYGYEDSYSQEDTALEFGRRSAKGAESRARRVFKSEHEDKIADSDSSTHEKKAPAARKVPAEFSGFDFGTPSGGSGGEKSTAQFEFSVPKTKKDSPSQASAPKSQDSDLSEYYNSVSTQPEAMTPGRAAASEAPAAPPKAQEGTAPAVRQTPAVKTAPEAPRPSVSSSSRIDELMRMLEEEKAKLAKKNGQ